jgi:ferrous iron transport protein A
MFWNYKKYWKGRYEMVKLSEIGVGQKAAVSDIEGDARFLSRITSIGITPGCEMEMIYNEGKLPLLLFGRDTVISLNREESKDI